MPIQTSFTTPSTAPEAIYNLITALCAAGWTVPAWSDGTTFHDVSNSPGVGAWPRVTNPYSGFGSGTDKLGNNNAWFRITAPDSSREWMFQRTTTDVLWTVARSKLGFAGTVAATAPTDAATGQTMQTGAALFPAVSYTHRWAISLETAAPYGFFAFLVPIGGGVVTTVLFDEPMSTVSIPSADTDPYVSGLVANGAVTPLGTMWSTYTSALLKVWKRLRHGLTGASYVRVSTMVIMSQAGIAGSTEGIGAPAQSVGGGYQVGIDPASQIEFPLPIVISAYGAAASTTGYGGICNRLRWCSVAGRNNGQTLYDAVNGLYWIFVGGMWVPWDNSSPNV